MSEARSVGSVSVTVVPDATGWSEKLRAAIIPGSDRIGSELGGNIGGAMYDRFRLDLERIRAELDLLGTRDVSIRIRFDDQGSAALAAARVEAVGAAGNSAGNGGVNVLGSRLVALGGLAIAGADVAIPAILAIGAAAAGALAGIGVLFLGFSGIGGALQAHGQKSGGGGGGGGASSALTQQSAQIQATQATQSAQDQLTQSVQAQAKAEKGLHDARIQALQDLQDLDNKLKDNSLSQEQAAINLDKARRTLAVTLSSPGASLAQYANQVAQAKLDVAAAQQKSDELRLTGQRLGVQDTTAHRQGVAGNPNVLAAQQTLVDANHKLAESQANIGITAQKNAIALQQAALGMASAAAGANAFGAAMAKLNPIQRQFVDFLLTLKPLLDQMKLAASQFLPGLEQGIKNAAPAFGPILQIIGNVAKAMGDVFANIGRQFATPEGQKFLKFLSVELPKQIVFLGNVFVDLGRIMANVFEAAGPLIDAFDKAFLGFLDQISKSSGGNGLKKFFDSLINLIPPFFRALTGISNLIGRVLTAIEPALGPFLDLIARIATTLADALGPVLPAIAQAFVDLINAVSPLIPIIGQMIATLLPPFIQLLDVIITSGIAPLATAIATALQPVLPVLAAALTTLVKAIEPLIPQLVDAIVPILGPMAKLFTDVLLAVIPLIPQFLGLLGAVTPMVQPFTDLVVQLIKLADKILPPIVKLAGPFLDLFANLLPYFDPLLKSALPFINAMTKLAETLQKIVDLIPQIPGAGLFKQGIGALGPQTDLGGGFTLPGKFTGGAVNTSGKRAAGGPVLAGHTYQVNENGPEFFAPSVNGAIINQQQFAAITKGFGGAPTRVNNFTVYGQSDPVATAHATANRFAARAV